MIDSEALQIRGGIKTFVKGSGVWLYDDDGKAYFDLGSNLFANSLGYGRTDIAKTLFDQATTLSFSIAEEGYTHPQAVIFAEKVLPLTPKNILKIYTSNSGSDAVEMALRITRAYHIARGDGGRYKIVARKSSYHGATFMTTSLGNFPAYNKICSPPPPGIKKVEQPNCSRCPYDKQSHNCDTFCAQVIHDIIEKDGPETFSAIILEPISVSAGTLLPPKAYLPTIREICDKFGLLLIFDEMITGSYRTGPSFVSTQINVQPDILVTGKGIASGYAPIGVVGISNKICNTLDNVKELPPGFTFSGHPISCAVASKCLEIMSKESVENNVTVLSAHLRSAIEAAFASRKFRSCVRGTGFLFGVEFVNDKHDSIFGTPQFSATIVKHANALGIHARCRGPVLEIAPPLISTEKEISQIGELLSKLRSHIDALV